MVRYQWAVSGFRHSVLRNLRSEMFLFFFNLSPSGKKFCALNVIFKFNVKNLIPFRHDGVALVHVGTYCCILVHIILHPNWCWKENALTSLTQSTLRYVKMSDQCQTRNTEPILLPKHRNPDSDLSGTSGRVWWQLWKRTSRWRGLCQSSSPAFPSWRDIATPTPLSSGCVSGRYRCVLLARLSLVF